MTFPDGDSYVGEWKNGNMHGWGAFYWNNGNSYQGRVNQGVMEGQALHFRWGDGAKLVCEDRTDCFMDGKIQKQFGKFRSVNRGPSDDQVQTKDYKDGWYVGILSGRGGRKGQGRFYFLNGDMYSGEWDRDKMNGRGIYQFKNGDRYDNFLEAFNDI